MRTREKKHQVETNRAMTSVSEREKDVGGENEQRAGGKDTYLAGTRRTHNRTQSTTPESPCHTMKQMLPVGQC